MAWIEADLLFSGPSEPRIHLRSNRFCSIGRAEFALEDGQVYHTYSAYSRGLDALWSMHQWLDRAPLGRNEAGGPWWKRRDEYEPKLREGLRQPA